MISVIVPVKNGADTIGACLKGILSQRGVSEPFEVLVVDDGSTDATAGLARSFGVKVISQANAGPAAARNTGAEQAQGRILAFTDADCVPSPYWLSELVKPFADPEVVGVKGVYTTLQKPLAARFVQQEYESKYCRMAKLETIDFIDTYSAAYQRNIFLENGGFDPAFRVPSVEDQEFSFRLARKGYRMIFAPLAVVAHIHDETMGEYFRRKFNIGYWKAFMLRWMPEKLTADSHTLPSQRWEILFLFLSGVFFLAGLLWPLAIILSGMLILAIWLLSVPLFVQIWHQDRPVLLLAGIMVLLRAAALGCGLAVGMVFPPGQHSRNKTKIHHPAIRLYRRSVDILGALIISTLSLPIVGLAALAIKLDDGGPVLFFQERAGENGHPFKMIKLRTMVVDADKRLKDVIDQNQLAGAVFKIKNDPRITRVGRVLRRWSIDELPQIWNVLLGDMSLIGPRPEETWVVQQYNDRERLRLVIRPGLTGPMQVNGRGNLDLEKRINLELDYINNYSIIKDVKILMKTIPAVLGGKGAY